MNSETTHAQRPDRYTANIVHVGGVYRDNDHIASCRGDNREARETAGMIAAALNSFHPDAIRLMRSQLLIARVAMARARDVLTTAAETHPDNGTGGILLPGPQPEPEGGGIAGDCEAAAQDAVEGLWTLDQLLGSLPAVIPFQTAEDAAAFAEAREAARPLKMAIVIEDGVIQQILTTKPAEALIIDHDIDGGDTTHVFRYQAEFDVGPDQKRERSVWANVHAFATTLEPGRVHEFQTALDDLTSDQPESECFGAACDDPGRIGDLGTPSPVIAADIPAVEPISEHDIAGRGHVIVCRYPFECPPTEALGKFVRVGSAIWRIRGVEHGAPSTWGKGQSVGLLVSPFMGCGSDDLGQGSREQAMTMRERFAAGAGEFTAGACELPGKNTPAGAAVFDPNGQPHVYISVDDVIGGVPAAIARAQDVAAALNMAQHAMLTPPILGAAPRSLILNAKQLTWMTEAAQFVWDEEGGALRTDPGKALTEAEFADIIGQLKGELL